MEVAFDGSWLVKRSQLSPTKIAIIDGETGEHWNYKELYNRTLNMADRLYQLGIGQGDRVAMLSPNDPSYFELLFACQAVGAIFVPLNWRLSEEELIFILQDCQAKCVFIHQDFSDMGKGLPFETIPLKTKPVHASRSAELPLGDSCKHAAIIYTGGTTGKPKGVILSHRNIASNAINTIISWGLSERDVTLTCLPMFHTGGLNALSTPLLMAGGTVVIMKDFQTDKVMDLLTLYHCTVVLMVPTMYHMLIEHPAFAEESFPSMKTFLSGGAPCPLEIYEAFFRKGKLFKEGYGLTEAGPNNFYIDPTEAYGKKGSVGKPMMFNEVKIVKENNKVAEANEVGEIFLKGPHVFTGYWSNKAETDKVKCDGWLRTGDLGKKDEDGYFYIVGRAKDLIISGGENVYPTEVEQTVSQHIAVKEVSVVGIPHPKWGEAVLAVVSLKRPASEKELTTYCSQRLGKYKVPKRFIFVKEIPKTAVGKIDKKLLMERYREIFTYESEHL
ncbi:fatty-acyl-CoA synthase [Bacillus tianshenii]|uniref:Fatty-acyl-CoA synthase n=1 Tax=Sutcliffiella tianshenii TaxID=1463404 RepID=A0ABS2P169_9BACI|nr:long-chain fatty acid--CoA ligase [Bacillus tianshenii]MBM7620710.1 fatty-acyl-CoA synthase [Bacillus tianshenii]